MFIEDIPNIKEILENALKDLKSKEVKIMTINPSGTHPTLSGPVLAGSEKISQEIKVDSENLTIRLHKLGNSENMIIYYDGEQVNYHTTNKEINNLLAEINEEFNKKCK